MLGRLVLYTFLAGITIFLGGLVANYLNHHLPDSPIKQEITHFMMSFGGGVILSAICLVFVPMGTESLTILHLGIAFLAGAAVFYLVDTHLQRKGGRFSMTFAMLLDFIPESIILGALMVSNPAIVMLIAIFMALQNFPEGFSAYRALVLSGMKPIKTLCIFFTLSFTGIIGGFIGYFFMQNTPILSAYLMIFSSGGILYLLFQDIAPESKLKGSYITSLGATLGFFLGLVSEKLLV